MKTFTIFANCQGTAVAQTLMLNKEFTAKHQWVEIPVAQNIYESDVAAVLDKIRTVDLLIYQPVADIPERPKEINSTFIINQLKDGATAISFPSIYFNGYFPHLGYLKGLSSALNLVHDFIIAYMCAIGITEQQTLALIQSDNLYPQQLSVDLANDSIKGLIIKEEQNAINIKISAFIQRNYKDSKLMNQFNHPRSPLVKYICEQILIETGINDYYIDEHSCSHVGSVLIPIYKSTYKNLGLRFEENFNVYNVQNIAIAQQQIINKLFTFYKSLPLEELEEIISHRKPFIIDIVKQFK